MVVTWDHAAHQDLIGAITDVISPSQEQLRGVAARMNDLGYSCTASAITYYIHIPSTLPFLFLTSRLFIDI